MEEEILNVPLLGRVYIWQVLGRVWADGLSPQITCAFWQLIIMETKKIAKWLLSKKWGRHWAA
jgi:hypothetical protein